MRQHKSNSAKFKYDSTLEGLRMEYGIPVHRDPSPYYPSPNNTPYMTGHTRNSHIRDPYGTDRRYNHNRGLEVGA
eukprot:3706815-Pleurochrysis_carterae.AAC.1